jgi:hypothetical protein
MCAGSKCSEGNLENRREGLSSHLSEGYQAGWDVSIHHALDLIEGHRVVPSVVEARRAG